MRALRIVLVVVGLLLLVPLLWLPTFASKINEQRAFAPLASIPLARIGEQAIVLGVTAPNDADWLAIRNAWGDPGYLIAGVSQSKKVIPELCADRGRSARLRC